MYEIIYGWYPAPTSPRPPWRGAIGGRRRAEGAESWPRPLPGPDPLRGTTAPRCRRTPNQTGSRPSPPPSPPPQFAILLLAPHPLLLLLLLLHSPRRPHSPPPPCRCSPPGTLPTPPAHAWPAPSARARAQRIPPRTRRRRSLRERVPVSIAGPPPATPPPAPKQQAQRWRRRWRRRPASEGDRAQPPPPPSAWPPPRQTA